MDKDKNGGDNDDDDDVSKEEKYGGTGSEDPRIPQIQNETHSSSDLKVQPRDRFGRFVRIVGEGEEQDG